MTQVIVAGGGPAGIAAAVAASRQGAETLLIERYGFLGGMATAGLVNPFMPWHANGSPLVAGIFEEMHTLVGGVAREGSAITSIRTESKSGTEEWTAALYVDCTGDADLAFRAGVPCDHGRDEDHLAQPMTLNFRMAGVEIEQMPTRQEINRLFDQAKAEGRLHQPRENVLFFYTTRPGVVHFNTTRVTGLSGADADDLTAAEIEARRQAHELAHFLVARVPGFERAYLEQSGAQIGVRESRRIRGDYALTGDDVVNARKFPDGIARSNYPIDIHSPTGSGTVIREVPAGNYYQIPYRCLLPVGVDNLLVAGRCVSATHEGQSSLRVMPQCFAMGQAAGVAAAMAVRSGISPRQVSAEELRQALRKQGQIV